MDQDWYEIRVPKLELGMTTRTHYYSAHVPEGQNFESVPPHLFRVLFYLIWVEHNVLEASWERSLLDEEVMNIEQNDAHLREVQECL